MRDGQTPLSEDFFNGVFGDIDNRIAELEARRADLQGVVDELTKFGLARIDALVGPSMAEVNAMLAQLRQRRDELEAAIGNVADLATKGDVATAKAERVGSVNGLAGQAITLEPKHLQLGPANGPSQLTLSRDANGRLESVESTVNGKNCTQTLTYNEDGSIATVTAVHDGRRRVQTMTYESGELKSIAAVEVLL